MGHTNDEWVAGFHYEDTRRRSIGFFGYEETQRAGSIHIHMDSQRLHGWGKAGKTEVLGNLRYSVLGYMGRDGFPHQYKLNLDDNFSMGVKGDFVFRSGVFGRGLELDVSVWDRPGISVMPFLQSFSPHKIRWGAGYDSSRTVFSHLDLEHQLTSDSLLNARLTVYTDIDSPLVGEVVWTMDSEDSGVLRLSLKRTDDWRLTINNELGRDWRYEASWRSSGSVRFMVAYRFF